MSLYVNTVEKKTLKLDMETNELFFCANDSNVKHSSKLEINRMKKSLSFQKYRMLDYCFNYFSALNCAIAAK